MEPGDSFPGAEAWGDKPHCPKRDCSLWDTCVKKFAPFVARYCVKLQPGYQEGDENE